MHQGADCEQQCGKCEKKSGQRFDHREVEFIKSQRATVGAQATKPVLLLVLEGLTADYANDVN
jgi:hypothetical protein